jgi:hypothetical protein
MFNLKIAGIAAAVGFVLSFLISLLSRVRFPQLLVRPIFFGFLVLVCGSGFYILIKKFLQELLPDEAEVGAEEGMGSEVDINIGDEYGFDASGLEAGGGLGDGAYAANDGGLAQNTSMSYNAIDAVAGGQAFADLTDDSMSSGSSEGGGGSGGGSNRAFTKVSSDSPFEDADPKRVAGAIQNLLMDD